MSDLLYKFLFIQEICLIAEFRKVCRRSFFQGKGFLVITHIF